MSAPLNPLADWVVAEQEEAVTKTASGLYLPDKAAERPKIAKVVKTGKEVKEIKVGDRIVYKTYSTTEVKVNDKE
jgi:chaperonin GroES